MKDGYIYSTELDRWTNIRDYLQNIVNTICNEMDNTKFEMTFIGCSVESSKQLKSPYIRVYSKWEADDVHKILNDMGIENEIDLYEDDDGSDVIRWRSYRTHRSKIMETYIIKKLLQRALHINSV